VLLGVDYALVRRASRWFTEQIYERYPLNEMPHLTPT
jgi:hypothetical protein